MTFPRRALLAALFALVSLPVAAADPWDAPPFSADPKALIEAARKVNAGEHDLILLLDEGTHSVEADGRIFSRQRLIYSVVTAKGVEMLDSTSAPWAPWYDERPEIRAR